MTERSNDPGMQKMYQELMKGIGSNSSKHQNKDESNIIDIEEQE